MIPTNSALDSDKAKKGWRETGEKEGRREKRKEAEETDGAKCKRRMTLLRSYIWLYFVRAPVWFMKSFPAPPPTWDWSHQEEERGADRGRAQM